MKVKCRINIISDTEDVSIINRLERKHGLNESLLKLRIDKEYCVYGIVILENFPWFYLCPNKDDVVPFIYPAEMFDVIDGQMPSYWRLSRADRRSSGNDFYDPVITFFEWAEDHSYSNKLFSGDPNAIKVFGEYRALMDKEAGIINIRTK